jgi:hypothetical protein
VDELCRPRGTFFFLGPEYIAKKAQEAHKNEAQVQVLVGPSVKATNFWGGIFWSIGLNGGDAVADAQANRKTHSS